MSGGLNFETAVVLVHHARKSAHARGGQALRGSLHAWGDSNLRRKKRLLTVEHRASKSPDEIALRETPILSLQIVEAASEAPDTSPRQRSLLADLPLSQRQGRSANARQHRQQRSQGVGLRVTHTRVSSLTRERLGGVRRREGVARPKADAPEPQFRPTCFRFPATL